MNKTDIIAGIESEMDTVLVPSGVSAIESIKDFAYSPKYILIDVVVTAGIED